MAEIVHSLSKFCIHVSLYMHVHTCKNVHTCVYAHTRMFFIYMQTHACTQYIHIYKHLQREIILVLAKMFKSFYRMEIERNTLLWSHVRVMVTFSLRSRVQSPPTIHPALFNSLWLGCRLAREHLTWLPSLIRQPGNIRMVQCLSQLYCAGRVWCV